MKNNHSISVGDVMVYSWGWEQTNIQFFQVVKVTKASVKVREINDEREYHKTAMVGTTTPVIDEFKNDEVMTKRVQKYEDSEYIRMDYGSARPWNKKPQSFSFYA